MLCAADAYILVSMNLGTTPRATHYVGRRYFFRHAVPQSLFPRSRIPTAPRRYARQAPVRISRSGFIVRTGRARFPCVLSTQWEPRKVRPDPRQPIVAAIAPCLTTLPGCRPVGTPDLPRQKRPGLELVAHPESPASCCVIRPLGRRHSCRP